jgi:prepilin-type N-terminal cleavage/methylation domain-containing protein
MQRPSKTETTPGANRTRGFTLIELAAVVMVVLIAAAVALPQLTTAVHTFRLRGVGSDFSGIVQTARWRAVQDDRFYSVRFITQNGPLEAYVDIYPQNTNGSSGNGAGGPMSTQDPQITINSEVSPQQQGSAPNTSNLQAQILPASSPVVPLDGDSSTTPVTFGPRGLPCVPTTTNGGTVCDSAGGPQAYWVFFQNTVTKAWSAVTVTPAGRMQNWYYSGSSWVANQM